jgi:OmpA-OmpF porin, OOP family
MRVLRLPTLDRCAVALAALALPLQAGAGTPSSTSYFGFTGGYLHQGAGVTTEETRQSATMTGTRGISFQALYGSHSGEGFGWEFLVFEDVIDTGLQNGTDFYRPGAGLDLVYNFGNRIGFTPFALLGGGGAYNDQDPDRFDDWSWYGDFALGFVSGNFGKGVHLRGEARYVYDSFRQINGATGVEDVRVSLGVEVALWDKPKKQAAPPPPPPPPPPQVVIQEVRTGLEDSDQDGVVDPRDKCPGTPAGTRIDGDGCPLPKVITLRGVTFEFAKATLRPDSRALLDSAAETLRRYPGMQVEVAGHTDNVGSDAYNQELSERRAHAVRAHLIGAGIPAGDVTAAGYGEAEPVAPNDTDEGRELNRRVELRIKD